MTLDDETRDPEHEGEGHEPAPHDQQSSEPLGPATPDEETELGDTPEAHDEISPHDLPTDHPGREEAARIAGGGPGVTEGEE